MTPRHLATSVALLLSLAAAAAHADGSSPPPAPRADDSSLPPAPRAELGVRAGVGGGSKNASLAAGIDLVAIPSPWVGVGFQYSTSTFPHSFDDPYYSEVYRSLDAIQLFAEGRVLPRSVLTPYARVGAATFSMQGQHRDESDRFDVRRYGLVLEQGLHLHARHVGLRIFVQESLIADAPLEGTLTTFGVQLGALL